MPGDVLTSASEVVAPGISNLPLVLLDKGPDST
jgi:hypothetical protein